MKRRRRLAYKIFNKNSGKMELTFGRPAKTIFTNLFTSLNAVVVARSQLVKYICT